MSLFARVSFGFVCAVALLGGCSNQPLPTSSPSTASPETISPSPIRSPSPTTSPEATPTADTSQDGNKTNTQLVQQIESKLSKTVAQTTGVPVQSVNCPEAAEIKAGSRFDCKVSSDGQPFAIAVEVTDPSGPQFKWSTQGLLLLSKLEQAIQSEIKQKSAIEVTATCGSNIRVAKPGDTFECRITDTKGHSRSVRVTVKDDQGRVDYALI